MTHIQEVMKIIAKEGNQVYIDDSTLMHAVNMVNFKLGVLTNLYDDSIAGTKALYILAYINGIISIESLTNNLIGVGSKVRRFKENQPEHDIENCEVEVYVDNMLIDMCNNVGECAKKYGYTPHFIIQHSFDIMVTLIPYKFKLIFRHD